MRLGLQVARFFNEPLLTYYATNKIAGLDEAVYGPDPIYYLCTAD